MRVPIERRIREGAERNAGVLDPDVDRFLDTVVHRTRRRRVVHRSLTAAASVAVVAIAVALGPGVFDRIGNTGGTVPGSDPSASVAPSVTPGVPLLTGTFTRTIPAGTAVVGANHLAGTWTISAESDGRVRVVAPASFPGAHTSRPFELQTNTLRTDAFRSDLCAGLAPGTYAWSRPADNVLVLTVESDPCDARVQVLAMGAWTIPS